jgi:acyl carrier protein
MPTQGLSAETFVSNLERHLGIELTVGTRLQDLPEWTSLQALIVAASFNWDYGVTISADEFRRADSVVDLYGIVNNMMRE